MKAISTVIVALIAALVGLNSAHGSYTYTSVNYPGSPATVCGGINGAGTIACTYADTGSDTSDTGHGFVLSGGNYTPVNYPDSSGTWIDGSPNDGGDIVGQYETATECNGFRLSQGLYTPLTYPGATGCTCAIGINNGGAIVGRYKKDGVTHGFALTNGTYTTLDYPGATSTRANDINNSGTIVGEYTDSDGVSHGFVLSGGNYVPLDYPGATPTPSAFGFSGTVASGINDAGVIVGYYTDMGGVTHGFALSGGSYAIFDRPGAQITAAFGINNAGVVVGAYADAGGATQGFVATPVSAQIPLTLTKLGTGSGTVTSSPSGINCGGTCTASYDTGTSVTLTATADQGSSFVGWSGPCSGNGVCAVTLTESTQVTATFVSSPYFDMVQKFYIGYYQRPADAAGLLFWVNALAQIDTTHTGVFSRDAILPILHDFAFSDEARSLYNGDITGNNIATVVNSIYLGLFARPAEPGGLAFYVNGFNSGGETPATILWSVMNGAQGTDALSVQNKVTVAMSFTRVIDPDLDGQNFQVTYAGNADAQAARTYLAAVTSDTATIPTPNQVTSFMKTSIADPGDGILSQ